MGDFIGSLIGVAIAIVVGVALVPVVLSSVQDVQSNASADNAVKSLVNLLPIVLIAIVVAGAVMYITSDNQTNQVQVVSVDSI